MSVNGVCLDTIIENCKDYNDDNTCKVCEDYHLIVDEECVEQEGDC
ncbi:MAG: hypothetical protein DHS20C13_29650 [Thermodesulfobacteriota bacterium]|nr:MAG: hypothetical protein DHS20C13_29650 [Thermodesulfobacteriota bacterium]